MLKDTFAICSLVCLFAPITEARSLYLNGIDISGAKGQELHGVNMRIGENGDVYIEGPNYQVSDEDSFTPLSTYVHHLNRPNHKPADSLPQAISAVGKPELPLTAAADTAGENSVPTEVPPTMPVAENKAEDDTKAGKKVALKINPKAPSENIEEKDGSMFIPDAGKKDDEGPSALQGAKAGTKKSDK